PELTAYWLTRRAEARRSMADDAPVLAGSREAADELSARLRDEADHLVNLTAAVAGPLIAQQAGIYLDLMVPPAYD
ncbi:MAG TPA: hypothetical protein VHD60_00455, partial [Candidatus Saccharimonadales bacterium]|nr:hypothetical protein [Candidatus Saccharimonadales bacterium]